MNGQLPILGIDCPACTSVDIVGALVLILPVVSVLQTVWGRIHILRVQNYQPCRLIVQGTALRDSSSCCGGATDGQQRLEHRPAHSRRPAGSAGSAGSAAGVLPKLSATLGSNWHQQLAPGQSRSQRPGAGY